MKTLHIHTHLDGAEALKLIELLDTLRDTLAEQYANDISQSLSPCPPPSQHTETQAELPLGNLETPF